VETSRRRTDDVLRSHGGAAVAFTVLLAVMLAHETEHVAQVDQKDVALASCPNECRGLLGHYFDVEWVHFAYNASILVALLALAVALRLWRPRWKQAAPLGWAALTSGIVLQTYHFVEHTEKLDQWLHNGHMSPTPGFAGQLLPPPDGRNFTLIELHFTLNTAVLIAVAAGYFGLGFHRRAWAERTPPRLAVAAIVSLAALVGTGVGWSAAPPTIRLSAGVHPGPIVLDYPQRLVGERGAVVKGGIVVESNDVVVKDLTVVGGETGIEVNEASGVVLDRVRVRGATLDGISVRRGSVIIRDCRVEMAGQYSQGIDISFTMERAPSTVERCRVRGGQEGIMVDGAMADVRDNEVIGTRLRGITVNEMAMAHVVRNAARDAEGVGIYCGDYSVCTFSDNRIDGVRADGSGNRAHAGIGIVVDYHAHAELSRNSISGARARLATFAGGTIERG
jgi:nitrous oxidase accessory protein NosD